MDEIMQRLAQLPEAERLTAVEEAFAAKDKLKELKDLWRALGIRGGASAGPRTGLIGPYDNDNMQVDRATYRSFITKLNDTGE